MTFFPFIFTHYETLLAETVETWLSYELHHSVDQVCIDFCYITVRCKRQINVYQTAIPHNDNALLSEMNANLIFHCDWLCNASFKFHSN